jgi:hypothetical protein
VPAKGRPEWSLQPSSNATDTPDLNAGSWALSSPQCEPLGCICPALDGHIDRVLGNVMRFLWELSRISSLSGAESHQFPLRSVFREASPDLLQVQSG